MTDEPTGVFSDIQCEKGQVKATLLFDPSVRGLDTAIYMDGSQSMSDEYGHARLTTKIWNWLHLRSGDTPNIVEPEILRMLQYLATKDRNGQLRVAYWACGNASTIEVVGELTAADVATTHFPGPQHFGATYLKPALEDYVEYMREQGAQGASRGCAVIVTDGRLFDDEDVIAYSEWVAAEISGGRLPSLFFVIVGVGDEVDEEQLEAIASHHYPGVEHLWCHKTVEEMHQIADLVAVLVDEKLALAAHSRILDDRQNVVQEYAGRLPAVLEFSLPPDCPSFTLEVNGKSYQQALPSKSF